MPIGSPLTSPIPAVGSSGTGYATSINTLLAEMKAAIEGDVPFSSLSGQYLAMGNLPIIEIQYAKFEDQVSAPSAAIQGRLVYAGGEFFAVNSTGAIQITSGGTLNAAALGGISGDYGGANPASVRFVDAATRYDFYDDYPGLAWAYQRSRGVDISAGAVSSFFVSLRYGGAASYTLTLPPALPVSNSSVVTIDSTGALLTNTAINTITNDIVLAGTSRVREIGKKLSFTFNWYSDEGIGVGVGIGPNVVTGVVGSFGSGILVTAVGIGGGVVKLVNGLDVGSTITSVVVRMFKAGVASSSVYLYKVRDNVATQVSSGSSSAAGWVDMTAASTYVVEAGYQYAVIVFAANVNDVFSGFDITYNS